MSFLPSRSEEWYRINRTEDMKALAAELNIIQADIELHTIKYNPLNPDESLDTIYQLARRMKRVMEKMDAILLKEWVEAVSEAREKGFNPEEAADIERINNLLKTKEMGLATRKRTGTGRWRRTTR